MIAQKVVGLACFLMGSFKHQASALMAPDIEIQFGYYAGMYYRNFIFVNKKATFPNSGWEYNIGFMAWSLAAAQNTSNRHATFQCFWPCQKTSPTWRHVLSKDPSWITKANGCDMSAREEQPPFCVTEDWPGSEKLVVGYFQNPRDKIWDFQFVMPAASKMFMTGDSGDIGGYFSNPPPIVPQHDVPLSLHASWNRWTVKYTLHAKTTTHVTCHGGYRLKSNMATCEKCPKGYYRKISAREEDLQCMRCPMNSKSFTEGGIQSLSCMCNGGYGGTDDASKVGMAAKIGGYTTEKFCAICSPGYYGQQGTDTCQPCQPGFYSPANGSSTCIPTHPGHFQNLSAQMEQIPCPPGSSNPSTAMRKCIPCGPGQYAEQEAHSFCKNCPRGKYTDTRNSARCEDCPAATTTGDSGAASASMCKCPPGAYRAVGGRRACVACEKGMECPFGSDAHAPLHSKAFPRTLPGFWTSPAEPLSVFVCGSVHRCPGGFVGSCGRNLTQRACSQCADGFSWSDGKTECVDCSALESSYFLFPFIPLFVGPLVVVIFYHRSGQPYAVWDQWRNALASIVFILLNHYQMLALVKSFGIQLPSTLNSIVWGLDSTNDPSRVLSVSCIGAKSFKWGLLLKCLGPAYVFSISCYTWGISQVLSKAARKPELAMGVARTWDGCTAVIFSFYAAIATACFSIFNCGSNPNGEWTLNSDRGVLCYQDDWNTSLVIGVFAIVCWLIGLGSLFIWAIVVAPTRFDDKDTRDRWQSLFIKYRPDVYWFAIVVVFKGILLTMGSAVISSPLWKLYWVILICVTYLCCVIACRPWRHIPVNVVDTGAHICVLLVCSGVLWFVQRSLGHMSDEDDGVETITAAFAFTTCPLAVGAGAYRYFTSTRVAQKTQDVDKLWTTFQVLGRANEASFKKIVSDMGQYEIFSMQQVQDAWSVGVGRTSRRRASCRMELELRQDCPQIDCQEVEVCNV